MKTAFTTLQTYAEASRAKINMDKIKGLGIGNRKENPPDFNEIKWTKSIKALGVEFGYDINYDEI